MPFGYTIFIMSDFLDKLNTLLRANLNTLLSGDPDRKMDRDTDRARRAITLGKDIDREIAALRKRVDEALAEEDSRLKRIHELEDLIVRQDSEIDAMLQSTDPNADEKARQLLFQLQRNRQRLRTMQAELEQHRSATSEFIERVNVLEATVADARRQEQGSAHNAAPVQQDDMPATLPPLSDMLRAARERVESAISGGQSAAPSAAQTGQQESAAASAAPTESTSGGQKIPVRIAGSTPVSPTTAPIPPQPEPKPQMSKAEQDEVDKDLAARRSRLSKPD
jgi:chromosome segregation ATPase